MACFGQLTNRETQILTLKAQGLSNDKIADQIFISRRTVETHFVNIKRKLDYGSLFELGYKFRESIQA